jgi:5-methylcytosine-specific restriction endonuclease McrA
VKKILPNSPRLKLESANYTALHRQVLERDNWRCQSCGSMQNLEVHHIRLRSRGGSDAEQNLITLCVTCHSECHRAQVIA